MITEAENFNVKAFVRSLCELGVSSSSKEIADFLTRKGHPTSWQVVAGIKGSFRA